MSIFVRLSILKNYFWSHLPSTEKLHELLLSLVQNSYTFEKLPHRPQNKLKQSLHTTFHPRILGRHRSLLVNSILVAFLALSLP